MEVLGNTFYFDWEISLMVWLQSHLGAAGALLANFFSMFGEELLMVAVLGFLYWCYDKKFGTYAGFNLLTANLWNPMIKNVCLRRRPYMDNPEILCLRQVDAEGDIYDVITQGYSFPSGHSTGAAALYGSIAAYKKKKRLSIIAYALILLVGVSRFCLGVHYPTDVLAGWALGFLAINVVSLMMKKIKKRWIVHAILLVTGAAGFFYCESTDYFTSYGMLLGFAVAVPFEEKYVNFEGTRSVVRSVLRIAGGCAIFFGLNTLLKLPFSSKFLSDGSTLSHIVRTLRYAIVLFVDMGVYPMIFKLTANIGTGKKVKD